MRRLLNTKVLLALSLLALGGSIAGNYLLFRKAVEFYTRESAVRLWPTSERFKEENAQIRAAEKSKPRVIIFGESRCSMWRSKPPEDWGDIELINRGIGGETTAQIRARLQDDVLSLKPDVVILQMGDNDIKAIAVLEERQEEIVELTYQNITAIAMALSKNGIKVVITTIFPTGPAEWARRPIWSDAITEEIDRTNERLLRFTAEGVTVVDCDQFLREGAFIKSQYSLDTLHLSPAGYEALNEGLQATMTRLIAAASTGQ